MGFCPKGHYGRHTLLNGRFAIPMSNTYTAIIAFAHAHDFIVNCILGCIGGGIVGGIIGLTAEAIAKPKPGPEPGTDRYWRDSDGNLWWGQHK
jgi:hypothetical protein